MARRNRGFVVAERFVKPEELSQGHATDGGRSGFGGDGALEKIDGDGLLIQAFAGQPAGCVEKSGRTGAVSFEGCLRSPCLDERLDLPLYEQVACIGVADWADFSIERERGFEGGVGGVQAAELFQELTALDFDPSGKVRVVAEHRRHDFAMRCERFHLRRAFAGARSGR